MTKAEIEDQYFHQYVVWCTTPPTEKAAPMIFWLDHNTPTLDNFWEWIVNQEKLKELK